MGIIIRYDSEFALSEAVKQMLIAGLSDEIKATHNVVAWFDPAAWEAGENKIVALSTDGSSQSTSAANSDMVIEVGVRTVLTQAKIEEKYNLHRVVVDAVRCFLSKPVDTMIGLINEKCEEGFSVYYCENKRDYSSDTNGSNLYSSVRFGVKCKSFRTE